MLAKYLSSPIYSRAGGNTTIIRESKYTIPTAYLAYNVRAEVRNYLRRTPHVQSDHLRLYMEVLLLFSISAPHTLLHFISSVHACMNET